jgi:hypothetical protein
MLGLSASPNWLDVDGLLRQFGHDRQTAREHYRRFVRAGVGASIWDNLRQQIYLGDEAFVEKMQQRSTAVSVKVVVPSGAPQPGLRGRPDGGRLVLPDAVLVAASGVLGQ